MIRYIRLIRNLSNWWLHFAVKLGLTDMDPLVFRTRSGIVIEVPKRLLHEFKEIFMDGCYMKGLKMRVPDTPIVIDIGANAGFFSLFAASRFPGARVFSYEPVANNFSQLERNRDLNKDARIMCLPKAVYGYSGKLSLSFESDDSFTTSANVFGRSGTRGKTIQVPCVSLSEVFDEHHLDRCDLLKIDCEGSEYGVLYNCPADYLQRVTQMTIEVHKGTESNQNMESLTEYLDSHGFKTRHSRYMLWACRRKN